MLDFFNTRLLSHYGVPGLQGADSTRGGKTQAFPSWTLTSSGYGIGGNSHTLCAVAPQQSPMQEAQWEGKSRQGLQKSFLEEVKPL